jgi:hypothetical protein
MAILIYVCASLAASADSGIDETYVKPNDSGLGAELLNLLGGRGANFDKSYALVIGVGNYKSFPRLDAPSLDAIRVRNFLRDEVGFDYITNLTDERATRERIEKLMEDTFPSLINSNDRFLFYFS